MIILTNSGTDKLQLVSGSAATLDVHASWVDLNADGSGDPGPGRTNTAITTATTTDIVATPAASKVRNVKELHVRNKHASQATDVTIVFDQNGTDYEIHKVNLAAGEALEYIEGIGWFELAPLNPGTLYNQATTSQSLGTSDVYLAGSFIVFPRAPKVGTRYTLKFDSVKTAAGTATPVITVRFGTAGTTSDTSRNAMTLAAQTAAADTATFDVTVVVRTAGASGVTQATCQLSHVLDSTGYSTGGASVQNTSSAFDLTVANLGIGVSFNGGGSHSGTLQFLSAILENT